MAARKKSHATNEINLDTPANMFLKQALGNDFTPVTFEMGPVRRHESQHLGQIINTNKARLNNNLTTINVLNQPERINQENRHFESSSNPNLYNYHNQGRSGTNNNDQIGGVSTPSQNVSSKL